MKHLKTFESYVTSLNEGKDFGDMTAAIGGGDNDAFGVFFKNAKKGDSFLYAANGVDLDYIDKADLSKKEIEVSTLSSSRDAKPVKCIIVDKKAVTLTGGSMEWEGDDEDTVFFTMEGDKEIYILTNTFE